MISLLYAGNERVFDGLLISCLSVAKHASEAVTVYVLTMDYTDKNPAYTPLTEEQCAFIEGILREKHPDSRVVRCDVGALYRTYLAGNPNEETSYTPYTLLRLLIDRIDLLPDKVLYLDTDTVFADDPAELFHLPLDGCEMGAVRDRYGCHFFGVNYCNAGVLLLNLAELRRTGALSKAAALCARKKIFLSDQSALNKAVGRKKILPRRFNEQKELRPDTLIRHFSMTICWFPFHTRNIKPWDVEQLHEVLHLYAFDDIIDTYRALIAKRASGAERSQS
jgi:lipopolysaccharide biosynthesis glycosyltransferase